MKLLHLVFGWGGIIFLIAGCSKAGVSDVPSDCLNNCGSASSIETTNVAAVSSLATAQTNALDPSIMGTLFVTPNPMIGDKNGKATVTGTFTTLNFTANYIPIVTMQVENEKTKKLISTSISKKDSSKSDPWTVSDLNAKLVYHFSLWASTDGTVNTIKGKALAVVHVSGYEHAADAPLPPWGVGVSRHSMFMDYFGYGVGVGDAPAIEMNTAMARKALADAKTLANVGLDGKPESQIFVRASSISKEMIPHWIADSKKFWKTMDMVFKDFEDKNLKVVPILNNKDSFAAIFNNNNSSSTEKKETFREFITNPNSLSYKMFIKYIKQFITRYNKHPALLMYEISGELNLDVDFYPRDENGAYNLDAYISTNEMIEFLTRTTAHIREFEQGVGGPHHPISSGFSTPRKEAEHLRATHEYIEDDKKQFEKNLKDIHQGFDVYTVHFYNGEAKTKNQRFSKSLGIDPKTNEYLGENNTNLLNIYQRLAKAEGKHLYIGEAGDQYTPTLSDDTGATQNQDAPFLTAILKDIKFKDGKTVRKIHGVDGDYEEVAISPFVFELYNSPEKWHPGNFEPGLTDSLLRKLRLANGCLNGLCNSSPGNPLVVMTSPMNGAELKIRNFKIVCLASSARGGAVTSVEISRDDKLLATINAPADGLWDGKTVPFKSDKLNWTPGEHTAKCHVVHKDVNKDGNDTTYTSDAVSKFTVN